MKTCPYCNQENDLLPDWHDCPQAQHAKGFIEDSIAAMHQQFGKRDSDDKLAQTVPIRIHTKKRKAEDWLEETA